MVDPLPEEVKQFMEANIDSVEQLEILRVLGEDPQREWPAAELAREVQTPASNILTHLAALRARGLLVTETRGADLFCRHGADSREREGMLTRLLQVYRERPVSMIRLVYARAKDPLKTFADAFRLKKEE